MGCLYPFAGGERAVHTGWWALSLRYKRSYLHAMRHTFVRMVQPAPRPCLGHPLCRDRSRGLHIPLYLFGLAFGWLQDYHACCRRAIWCDFERSFDPNQAASSIAVSRIARRPKASVFDWNVLWTKSMAVGSTVILLTSLSNFIPTLYVSESRCVRTGSD